MTGASYVAQLYRMVRVNGTCTRSVLRTTRIYARDIYDARAIAHAEMTPRTDGSEYLAIKRAR